MWCCGIRDDGKDDPASALQFDDTNDFANCGETDQNTTQQSPTPPPKNLPPPANPIMPQSGVTMQQCAEKNGVLV